MVEKKYILVIDNGLTVIKAAVFSSNGEILGTDSELNSVIDDNCFSELEPGGLWKKTATVIKKAIVKSKIKPEDISAIGNTGFGAGIFLVDKNGDPVGNAVTSMDSRALGFIEEAQKSENVFFEKTKINMWCAQAIPLLGWFKKNENAKFKKINRILQVKDWIKFKLTDLYSTDLTDAGNAGLVNIYTKEYDAELYRYYGLEEIAGMLPALKQCQEITGYVCSDAAEITGLAEGTPVMSGLQDVVACALGSGLYREDKYSIISGTWSINTAVGHNIVESNDIMACFLYADSKKYFSMDASPTSAVNLEWFLKSVVEKINTAGVDRQYIYRKLDEEISTRIKKKSQIIYLPFIYKSKLVNDVMGTFTKMSSSDDIFDLIYAIYQGVAFAHLMHIDNLKKGGVVRDCSVLSGGASNSDIWCQVFSDILNLEVQTVTLKEVGLLGTAVSVLMGLENIRIEDAILKMVNIKSVYKPDPGMNKAYMEKFQEFKKIINSLESV